MKAFQCNKEGILIVYKMMSQNKSSANVLNWLNHMKSKQK